MPRPKKISHVVEVFGVIFDTIDDAIGLAEVFQSDATARGQNVTVHNFIDWLYKEKSLKIGNFEIKHKEDK